MRWIPFVVATLLLTASPASAAVYRVGPGQPLATPDEVPWELLNPGDTVTIRWREKPYRSKWVLCRRGTAQAPITVRGIAGPGGHLPVIDGRNAVTRTTLNYWSGSRGVIKVGGANVPPDTTPAHLVIENLTIRNAHPDFRFVGRDGIESYSDNAAAIYVEKGNHITIRNCILQGCGNGFFSAADAKNVLVEGCRVYDNGIVGSIYQHNLYTAAQGITFQFNRLGPLREGASGNNLKDRSAGLVIRYNWIDGGNRQLDLVDGEDSPDIVNDPRYDTAFVYGNVLIEPRDAGNNQIVHFGGDSGMEEDYRQGPLHFYHNTVVSRRTGTTTLLRLSTNSISADVRNNVIYTTADGEFLAVLDETGFAHLRHNWMKTGWKNCHGELAGQVVADDTVTGGNPGFLDVVGRNFHLNGNAAVVNQAGQLAPLAHEMFVPEFEFAAPRNGVPRVKVDRGDLGAYEFDPATPAPAGVPEDEDLP